MLDVIQRNRPECCRCIKVVEAKPPLINQQGVVYKFKCDLCDADYVGYTCRHLFQRIEEHKHSAIGKHLRDAHNQKNKDLQEKFTILEMPWEI